MGIGDIGWSEFLFIAVLALLVLGPRRLPEIANAIGRSLREFRRALNEVQDEFRRELEVRMPAARPSDLLKGQPSQKEPGGTAPASEGEAIPTPSTTSPPPEST